MTTKEKIAISALNEILYAHANDNNRPKAFYIAAKALEELSDLPPKVRADGWRGFVKPIPPQECEPTEEMVAAYLQANDAYWREVDSMPTPPGVWRNGTPEEATRVSLQAALAWGEAK